MIAAVVFNMTMIDATRRADRSRIVAGFDAMLAGIRLVGCVVIQEHDGSLAARPPEVKARHVRDMAIRIIDPALDREFQAAALAAFRQQQGEVDGHIA